MAVVNYDIAKYRRNDLAKELQYNRGLFGYLGIVFRWNLYAIALLILLGSVVLAAEEAYDGEVPPMVDVAMVFLLPAGLAGISGGMSWNLKRCARNRFKEIYRDY